MKRIVKKNQVILTLLAVMIAVAGYLNYAGNMEKKDEKNNGGDVSVQAGSELKDISQDDLLAENQAAGESLMDVHAFPEEDNGHEETPGEVVQTGQTEPGNESENKGEIPSGTPGEAILTNGVTVADYVAAVQLNREQIRARNKETLLSVINNQEISEELKQSAVSMIVKMTETAELEGAVEMLLSAKGFDGSVVSIDSGAVDVVISRYLLSDAERAQIEDIVERKTGMSVESIVITLMELAEE